MPWVRVARDAADATQESTPRMVLVPQAPIRVLISSPSPAWSTGIASWLVPPLTRLTVAFGAEEALCTLASGAYHLAVLDGGIDGRAGADLAHEIAVHHPEVRVMVISPTCTREGLLGQLIEALGTTSLDPDTLTPLTEQERVVLQMMRRHLTYKEIAQGLGVSWHTVRTHAQSILRKRGVHSRRELESPDAWMVETATLAPEGAAA